MTTCPCGAVVPAPFLWESLALAHHQDEDHPITASDGSTYFVSVQDNGRSGLLLGPYESINAAALMLPEARNLARSVDDRAAFYGFGLARVHGGTDRVGRLNSLLVCDEKSS